MAGFSFEENLTHNQGTLIARNHACYPCVGLSFKEIGGVDVCVTVLFDTSCREFVRMVKLQMSVFCTPWCSCRFFPCGHFLHQLSPSSLYPSSVLFSETIFFSRVSASPLFTEVIIAMFFTHKQTSFKCMCSAGPTFSRS